MKSNRHYLKGIPLERVRARLLPSGQMGLRSERMGGASPRGACALGIRSLQANPARGVSGRIKSLISPLPFVFLLVFVTACGLPGQSSASGTPTTTPTQGSALAPGLASKPTTQAKPSPTANAAAKTTVFMILMENHNWSDIKGNADAPYINGTILPMASYAEQYYNPPGIHPSEPNYIWLEAGTNFGVTDDNLPSSNHQSSTMHLVTLLKQANIPWKSYQEGISGTTCPLNNHGLYVPRHNPMMFFDDVTGTNDPNSTYCISHIRPYTELSQDIQSQNVARYNFITPNLCNDMHNSCAPDHNTTQQGDTWLSQNLPTILNSQAYKSGGVVFITWDDGPVGDGPIGMIVLSSLAKGNGYASSVHYTHSSTLRTVEEIMGVTPLLGDAANATDFKDLFRTFPW